MKSRIQSEKECYECRTTRNIEKHHIFFGPNRKLSEVDGMTMYLCAEHHKGNKSPHQDREIDLRYKRMAQEIFEKEIANRETFIARYGRNYL